MNIKKYLVLNHTKKPTKKNHTKKRLYWTIRFQLTDKNIRKKKFVNG